MRVVRACTHAYVHTGTWPTRLRSRAAGRMRLRVWCATAITNDSSTTVVTVSNSAWHTHTRLDTERARSGTCPHYGPRLSCPILRAPAGPSGLYPAYRPIMARQKDYALAHVHECVGVRVRVCARVRVRVRVRARARAHARAHVRAHVRAVRAPATARRTCKSRNEGRATTRILTKCGLKK